MPVSKTRIRPWTCTLLAMLLALPLAAAPASAQDDMADVRIDAIRVADSIYMLTGQGGNMGLLVGDDGAFLIDDQFAPLTPRILAAVAALTDEPVRFVVNTHWHFDHTGGNENLGKAGAIIVAHENVRARMSTEQFMKAFDRRVPPAPEVALPIVTFTDAVTFHWNGEAVRVEHVEPAHTDGDAFVHFPKANVVHAGDIYFNGLYPFIDAGSGGSIGGTIRAVDRVLARCNDRTKIIPGHGPLSGVAELRAYRAMLVDVRDRMQEMIDAGRTLPEIVAAKPTAAWDAAWGKGFLAPDAWVRIVYAGMAAP
jgi:glyoxylase-like metal-dependent hydrolase (beta-lactamase superfamily II)